MCRNLYIYMYISVLHITYDSIPLYYLYVYNYLCNILTYTTVTEHRRSNKCIVCNYVFKNNKKSLHIVAVFCSEGI